MTSCLNYSRILHSQWLCGSQIHPPCYYLKSLCKMQIEAYLSLLKSLLLTGWSPGPSSVPNNITVECYSFPHSPFRPLPLSHLILFLFPDLCLPCPLHLEHSLSLHSHLILPFPTPTHPVSTRINTACISLNILNRFLSYLEHFLYNYFKVFPPPLNSMLSYILLTYRKYWIKKSNKYSLRFFKNKQTRHNLF